MDSFKAGQKVKCIEGSVLPDGLTEGKIYVVKGCDGEYTKVIDDSGTLGNWFTRRFEAVAKPKTSKSKAFKLGQSVRTTEEYGTIPAGRKGTVVGRSYFGKRYYHVQLNHAIEGKRVYAFTGAMLKGLKGRPATTKLAKLRKR